MTTPGDSVREQQRRIWDRSASGWGRWDHIVQPMLAGIGAAMIDRLALRPDSAHLDVASGTGEPGLTIARQVPRGRVVLTDLAPAMLAYAADRAAAKGLAVEVRACSADALPFGDATFHSVSCRMGLMFVPDIAGALAEMRRVLRPGGRLALSVWAEPAGNPWATVGMAALAAEIVMPPPDPTAPGLFRCAAAGAVAGAMQAAGFRDVDEIEVASEMVTASPEEFWTMTCEVAAPLMAAMAGADTATRQRIGDEAIRRAAGFMQDGQVRLPAKARVLAGTA
ncbi:MAG: methyltransferase domain-containing protein [Geminicoccaceae bacterium]